MFWDIAWGIIIGGLVLGAIAFIAVFLFLAAAKSLLDD